MRLYYLILPFVLAACGHVPKINGQKQVVESFTPPDDNALVEKLKDEYEGQVDIEYYCTIEKLPDLVACTDEYDQIPTDNERELRKRSVTGNLAYFVNGEQVPATEKGICTALGLKEHCL